MTFGQVCQVKEKPYPLFLMPDVELSTSLNCQKTNEAGRCVGAIAGRKVTSTAMPPTCQMREKTLRKATTLVEKIFSKAAPIRTPVRPSIPADLQLQAQIVADRTNVQYTASELLADCNAWFNMKECLKCWLVFFHLLPKFNVRK